MKRTLLGTFVMLVGCGASVPAAEPPSSEPGPVAEVPGAGGSGEPSAEVSSATGASDGQVFRFRVPQPGDARTDEERLTFEMTLKVTQGGKEHVQSTKEIKTKKRRTEALASNESAITKKRVTYRENTREQMRGERSMRQPSPLSGKTYVVALENGTVTFARDDGSPITEIEREELAKDNRSFGKKKNFADVLPDRALSPGEILEVTPDQLADVFGGAEGIRGVTLKFIGLEQHDGKPVGAFEMTMATEEMKKGMTTTTELRGRVLITRDEAWPVEIDLSGPITITGGDASGSELAGEGEMRLVVKSRYE